MIPRILHQIWIGESVPDREKQWCAQMKSMNPNWEYHFHRDELLQKYASDPYVRSLRDKGRPTAFLTDRLRVLLLQERGGLYLDCDCQPIRPLDTLAKIWDDPNVEFVIGCRNPFRHMVALSRGVTFCDNTMMASAPNSRLIRRIAALWRPEMMQGAAVVNGNACGLEALANLDGVTDRLLGYRYFYDLEAGPSTVVLHDNANLGSWVQQLKSERMATV